MAQAAQKAIELGGIYDGHEAPARRAQADQSRRLRRWPGRGWWFRRRTSIRTTAIRIRMWRALPKWKWTWRRASTTSTDFLAYADVGTVLHPHSLGGQMLGRSTLGIAHAIGQKWVIDPQYGITVAKRFYQNKPPTILDVPVDMQWNALNIPDPETPVGARGVGEPPVGGGCAAILNALADALGDEIFQRAPVNADTILTSLEAGRPMQHPLMAHI